MTDFRKSPMWVNPPLSPMHTDYDVTPQRAAHVTAYIAFSHEPPPETAGSEYLPEPPIPSEPDAPIKTATAQMPEPTAPDTSPKKPPRRKVSKPKTAKETKPKK